MRKLILIIALTMVPLGIWTAGCRNENRQAAFPNTPEMKSLARSSEKDNPTAAPVIPPKPIDREILNLPENDTFARVQAVNDRANQYAAKEPGHGMFTLPEEKNYVASAFSAPTYNQGEIQAAPAAMIPVPSAREFWSKPATRRGNNGRVDVPADVSAMAAPGANDDRMIPPAPFAAPATPALDNFILPPDDMPGVFMVGEDNAPNDNPPPSRGWFGMLRRNKGDALGAPPASSRRQAAPARPRAEVTERGPMKLDIGKLLGSSTPASAPALEPAPTLASAPMPEALLAEQRFAASAPEAFPPIAPGARIVSSVGMNFEPLPEPIPLEQYNAMKKRDLSATPAKRSATQPELHKPESAMKRADAASAPVLPLPAALISTAPAIPELTEAKVAVEKQPAKMDAAAIPGAAEFANMEKALEPLPDIASLGPTPSKTSMKGKVVAMPEPMPAPMPTPEAAAAKAALLEFSPEAMDEAFAELNKNEFFKTDFWEPAAKTPGKTDAKKDAAQERKFPALPSLPELSEPAELTIPAAPPIIEPERQSKQEPVLSGLEALTELASPEKKSAPAEPRKVRLQPVRKVRAIPELDQIDSATEVPPLRF